MSEQDIESRFNCLNHEELITQSVFEIWAKPLYASLLQGTWDLAWVWWTWDFPLLRNGVNNIADIFESLWVRGAEVAKVILAMDWLEAWQGVSEPVELIRNSRDMIYDILTFMKRPDGVIQFTIMSQRKSIDFINKIRQSSQFVSFKEDAPEWSSHIQQNALHKLSSAGPDIKREEILDAITCFKLSFENLRVDLETYEWMQTWWVDQGFVSDNNSIRNDLWNSEKLMFFRPFNDQLRDGLGNISYNLKKELLLMNDFFHHAIPTFLLRPDTQSWLNIHVLNWKHKWTLNSFTTLYENFGISDIAQQSLFAEAISNERNSETFIKTNNWNLVMQSKQPITWWLWWQATLMPIWNDIIGKKIWMSPYNRLKWVCRLIELFDFEQLIDDNEGLIELRGHFWILKSVVHDCLLNMKKWKLKLVWENIWTLWKSIDELSHLANERSWVVFE